MSGNGLSFTGDWEYDQGGCGSLLRLERRLLNGPCRGERRPAPGRAPTVRSRALPRREDSLQTRIAAVRLPGERPGAEPGETVDISPKPVKATAEQVLAAIQELLIEEEEAEIFAALAIRARGRNRRRATP